MISPQRVARLEVKADSQPDVPRGKTPIVGGEAGRVLTDIIDGPFENPLDRIKAIREYSELLMEEIRKQDIQNDPVLEVLDIQNGVLEIPPNIWKDHFNEPSRLKVNMGVALVPDEVVNQLMAYKLHPEIMERDNAEYFKSNSGKV